MDIAILTPDGHTRLGVIVADLSTAQALNPGMLCVPRGTGADLTAIDPPVASMPEAMPDLTARQIRLALTRTGLRQAVEQAVAAAGGDLRDWWEYSIAYERRHPLVESMAVTIGATPEQVDALWQIGATL